jgi:type I restriction enzyme S subunit
VSPWSTTPLDDLAESVDYGVTASALSYPAGPRFLRITDIQNGRVEWNALPWCECDGAASIKASLSPGDILFARTGATTGKTFLVRDCPVRAVFASYLIRVRLSDRVDARFLSHYFQTSAYWAQIASGARGVAQPGVNATTLKTLLIPTPPIREQRRIANVLDHVEALRTKRRAALIRFDDLTCAHFLERFGHPARNTKNLPLVDLGSLGQWQSGGTPRRSNEEYFRGDEIWFSSGELGPMYVSQSREHISAESFGRTSSRRVPKGALMLGMYDTAALKASIAAVDCSCNQAVAFSVLDPGKVETLYAYFAIAIGRDHFRRLQRGVRQKNLNLTMIRELRIPVPPVETQREFARRVAAIEKLKSVHRASLAKLDELFASLQYRAFRGEL